MFNKNDIIEIEIIDRELQERALGKVDGYVFL